MTTERPLKAIVCDFDQWGRSALGQQILEAGFDLLGDCTNGIEALQQNTYLHPTLVVIAHEIPGMSGLDVCRELRAQGDEPPEVIIVSTDDSLRELAAEAGAFELLVKGETDMFARLLVDVRELLETGERRKPSDRRDKTDRREHQDWSKVVAERRRGTDRRDNLRREKDVTSIARENLSKRELPPV